MPRFKNLFRTIPLLLKLRSLLKRQNNFIKSKANQFPDWCDDDIERRMKDYALRSTLILGEGFALLRNKSLTKEERARYCHLGFSAPNIDDLTDQPNADKNQLEALVTVPEQFFTLHFKEQWSAQVLKNCYRDFDGVKKSKDLFKKLISAQLLSQRQTNSTLSEKELIEITKTKGGLSVQLFHSLLEHDPKPNELEAAHQLGYVIQLLDDLFDLFSDQKEGVQTLANSFDLDQFINDYEKEWNKLKSIVYKLDYPKSQKTKALNWWYFFIATAFMYVGQLKRSGLKNLSEQNQFEPKPFNWEWPDLFDGMERGLKEKF